MQLVELLPPILAVTKFGAIIKRDGWPEFTRGGWIVRLFEVGIG